MQSAIKSVRSVAAIMLLIVISTTSFSQTSQFSVSINALTTNFNYGSSNKVLQPYKKNFSGVQAGVSHQAGITPMFSVVPEVYFAIKGGSLKENNPLTVGKSTLRLSTIEMPVLARLHCNKLYINAGPYINYALSGRLKIEGSGAVSKSSTKISFGNAMGDFKRWDFGVLAGAGYNFNIKRTPFTLDARYGYSLTNISNDVQRYNRVLNISLVVARSHKKKSLSSQG